MIGTYGEGGVPQDSPSSDRVTFAPVASDSPDAGLVSFGMVTAENGFKLAAYDVFGSTGGGLAGSSTAATGRATVIQALAPTPWGAPYGMLTDRFGVTWIAGAAGS